MAQYLQSVILSLTKGLGVTVNANADPDLARALSTVYGSLPPAISIQMYSNSLDVEFGAQQVTSTAGPGSTIQPNPFQNQAIVTINKAVESALSDQGDFQSQSALMLRSLKTQAAVYTQWQTQLQAYPAATSQAATTASGDVIQASQVDMGDGVYNAVVYHAEQMANTYASVFNMMATASVVSADIAEVAQNFMPMAKADLARLKSLFSFTQMTSIKESLEDVSNGLTSFVFASMMVEASAMVFSLDRIAQMAISPIKAMTNGLATNVTAVQGATATTLSGVLRSPVSGARVQAGPLAGLISTNSAASACGSKSSSSSSSGSPNAVSKAAAAVSQKLQKGTDLLATGATKMSQGMNELSTLIDYGTSKANDKIQRSLISFRKLMSRSQTDLCSQVQLLTMVNNLSTLSSLADAVLKQQQNGSSATQTSTTLLATLGSILAATTSGNGATYTVQNGNVTVNPPSIPAPTAAAAAVLTKAGVQTTLAGISQAL
jgi:hypothetical protein